MHLAAMLLLHGVHPDDPARALLHQLHPIHWVELDSWVVPLLAVTGALLAVRRVRRGATARSQPPRA